MLDIQMRNPAHEHAGTRTTQNRHDPSQLIYNHLCLLAAQSNKGLTPHWCPNGLIEKLRHPQELAVKVCLQGAQDPLKYTLHFRWGYTNSPRHDSDQVVYFIPQGPPLGTQAAHQRGLLLSGRQRPDDAPLWPSRSLGGVGCCCAPTAHLYIYMHRAQGNSSQGDSWGWGTGASQQQPRQALQQALYGIGKY